MMKILGIDPGLQITGYGLIQHDGHNVKLIETGTINPNVKDSLENRINKIYLNLENLIIQYQPDIMVIEKLYAHYRHPVTASLLGHVRGVICLLCAQQNVKLAEHSVKRIRKAVTGSGRASKEQTKKMVAHTLGISPDKLATDASDALALALGYIGIKRY
ncbi:MAG: crossover junction endodeoxyribonuclease RuvC [Candidatus Omnitrophota bacterium]